MRGIQTIWMFHTRMSNQAENLHTTCQFCGESVYHPQETMGHSTGPGDPPVLEERHRSLRHLI